MGKDKALIEIWGRPLIAHALSILEEAGIPGAIAGSRSDLSAYGPVTSDEDADLGPLSGICSALASTNAEWAVFIPVDMPLLPSALIAFLVDRAQRTGQTVTLVSLNGFSQTFPVVLRRDALAVLKAHMRGGNAGCYSAFVNAARYSGQTVDCVPAELLVQTGEIELIGRFPPLRWFQNLNTPEDVSLLNAYSSFRDRVS